MTNDHYVAAELAAARLAQLERLVAAQGAALARVPLNMPVPPGVHALLATATRDLDGLVVPARERPRLVALHGRLQAMIEDLELRKRELWGRLATVRAARRAGHGPSLIDFQS
ncbi:MAG TPA: hypothetical protein VME46_16540 [Acidimicrobiales bacterium]|nr:hypothetical protein [Acidimicrobiales bacterium]